MLVACALFACGPGGRRVITPPAPGVLCADCDQFGRVAPGTALRVGVSWMGWCEAPSVKRQTCEPQPFAAAISCSAPCATQATAGIPAGADGFNGWGAFDVRGLDAGSLTVTVELTHAQSSERSTTALTAVEVVEPTSLGVDCAWVEIEDGSTRPCGTDETVDHRGVVQGDVVATDFVRFGVFGERAGERVVLVPDTLELCVAGRCEPRTCRLVGAGDALHPACDFAWTYPTAGQVEVRVRRGGLVATRSLTMH